MPLIIKVALPLLLLAVECASFSSTQTDNASPQKQLAELEAASGGRLGVSALNTANNQRIEYRANERFPTQCTSKVIGVSAILKKSMTDPSLLQEKIIYTKKDLTNWTPITGKHIAEGMTVAELGSAAISYSDNTAMNLLVKKLGGIQEMTGFARSINNPSFRQDHGWPDEALSGGLGNVDDSSTPADMENSLQQLTLGNILAPYQRGLLLTWLKNNTTSDTRMRAGVPNGWIVGDKTGTGFNYGTNNDIGVIWPPTCAPIVAAIYYTNDKKETKRRDDLIASATRIVLQGFAQSDACLRKNLS